jgi:hypothetical protein
MKYGPETPTVEAFIQHLKGMTPEQWRVVLVAWDAAWGASNAADDAAREAAWDAASDAARDADWDAEWYAAWETASDAAWDAAAAWAARYAIYEILGATLLRERGQPFYFLPMFGFADPEAVLADASNKTQKEA